MGKGFWFIPILGLPLLAWIVLAALISVFSWIVLHIIVPVAMFAVLIAIVAYSARQAIKDKGKIGKIPTAFAWMGVAILVSLIGLFMYKPTAGYTLSIGQPISLAISGGNTTVAQASGGLFGNSELLSVVNTASLPASTEWIPYALAVIAVFLLVAWKIRKRR